MHVVTKILVVFCAVLSLLLAALTISYAANADRIRASWRGSEAARIAAVKAQEQEATHFANEKEGLNTQIRALQADADNAKNQLSALQAERTSLRADLERATADAASIRNQIAQLGSTTDTQAALIKAYREEVSQLREEKLSGSRREIELVDRINELESQREVLEQTSRALKEQLEETKLSASGVSGSPTGAIAATPKELSGPLIRAVVTETFTSPTGETMVVLDQGSNRGLREGTLMHVVRNGDQFIGSITLSTVEPTRSVGRLNTFGRNVAAAANDTVLSRLR